MRSGAAVLATMLCLPSISLAGRPGTPDDVVTWVDGGGAAKRPQVCVRFRNTADVDVGFFVEWSKNGRQFTGRDLQGDALNCGDMRHGSPYAASCASGYFSKPQGAAVRPSDEAKLMCLREFEPETEYCFRFRSFDADGLWSAFWSPTSCTRTPPVPQLPPAPAQPQLTMLPAETGRGTAGPPKPLRVLLEWTQPADGGIGQFLVQQRHPDDPRWYDIPETTTGPLHAGSTTQGSEFEVEIPFSRDPPSHALRYEFRVCSMNWGGRSCSPARKTPLGLQHEAGLDAKRAPDLATTNARLRAQVPHEPVARVANAPPHPGSASVTPNLDALAEQGAALAAEDALAAMLRESQADDEARRGFDIAMAAARDQTEWGPGKQKILDSLNPGGQSGFKTAISYLFDRNRHTERARIGAAISAADAALEAERSREEDARYRLGFDIATAIFGDPAQGAQGNTAAGPGSLGIRNSLSAPAQRGFDAAMKLHLERKY